MDYLTRRSVVAQYSIECFHGSGYYANLPRLCALGPRIHNRKSGLFVTVPELIQALEDTKISLLEQLPPPVEREYPTSEQLNLVDARKIEILLAQTGISSEEIERRSNAFFELLRISRSKRE